MSDNERPEIAASLVFATGSVILFAVLWVCGADRLILEDAPNFLTRYVLLVMTMNGAIGFAKFSYLFSKGKVKVWYRSDLSKIEEARIMVYSAFIFLPFLIYIPIFITSFKASIGISVLWLGFYLWEIIRIMDSIKLLRAEKRKSKGLSA